MCVLAGVLGLAGALWTLPVAAQQVAPPAAAEPRELIYCAELMSHEEREAYRARMHAARTPEERQAIRAAHRQEMQARAQAAGQPSGCEPTRRRWRGGRGD
jgi:hypothetical protein